LVERHHEEVAQAPALTVVEEDPGALVLLAGAHRDGPAGAGEVALEAGLTSETVQPVEVRQRLDPVCGDFHAVNLVDDLPALLGVGHHAQDAVDEAHRDTAETDVLLRLEAGLGDAALYLPAHGVDRGTSRAAGREGAEREDDEKRYRWTVHDRNLLNFLKRKRYGFLGLTGTFSSWGRSNV